MKTYGLIGYPLGHSFSAGYFAEKFAREQIAATYHNFAIPSIEALPDLLAKEEDLCGFNVTIPYKEQILPYLHELTPSAAEIGAVNCVKISRDNGHIHLTGHNTDVIGFGTSIEKMLQPQHRAALVLGTGGAAKAVIVALQRLGLEVMSVSRTPREGLLDYAALSADVMQRYKVIVNTTPCGMYPHTDECPPLPYELIDEGALLYDLIYNPAQTLFMQHGENRGAQVSNGLEMLHLQAEASWEIWSAP